MACSKKQWVSKIGEWKFKKNISSTEMSHVIRIQQKRKAESDKGTRVMVRGRVVPQENIDRWEKRQWKRHKTVNAKDPRPETSPNGKPPARNISRCRVD